MIRQLKTPLILFSFGIAAFLSGCEMEDPGPLQETSKDYSILDFDRLQMSDAFHIQVEQASTYSISVQGDKRNIDDLNVYKDGSTLVVRFDNNNANRKHETYITIKMPNLQAANFSGATESTISGFESDEELNLTLSGASKSQLEAGYRKINVAVSGASNLVMRGLGDELHAEVSGASVLQAFEFPVRQAIILTTGASHSKVMVSDELEAVASGASSVVYRGTPTVSANASGGSSIRKD